MVCLRLMSAMFGGMMKILMYTHNMNIVNGGVTYALYNRSKVLAKSHDVTILTHGFLTENQIEEKKVNIVNFFDILANKERKNLIELPQFIFENERVFPDLNNPKNKRIFVNGLYKQYRIYENGKLKVIDVFDDSWTRTHKLFIKDDKITRIVTMNKDNKPVLSLYIKDGNCFLTTRLTGWVDKIAFDHVAEEETSFEELKYKYVKEYIVQNGIETIFIDKREDVAFFLQVKKEIPQIKLFFFLHSNHYQDYKRKERHHTTLDDVRNNLESLEKVVVLTKRQLDTIAQEWNCPEKLVHIGNIIDYKKYPNTMKSRYDFITVGRYVRSKNVSGTISAMRIVQKKYPKVTLDLYGYGPEKENLVNEAKGLNITVNGFATDAQKLISKYSGFIMTSEYEGQGLVLLEAFDSQTPVFAYDIDFGPSDIVDEGDNGTLIRYKTPEEMAEKIILYIEGKLNFPFKIKAYEKFSFQEYEKKILALVEPVESGV